MLVHQRVLSILPRVGGEHNQHDLLARPAGPSVKRTQQPEAAQELLVCTGEVRSSSLNSFCSRVRNIYIYWCGFFFCTCTRRCTYMFTLHTVIIMCHVCVSISRHVQWRLLHQLRQQELQPDRRPSCSSDSSGHPHEGVVPRWDDVSPCCESSVWLDKDDV